MIATNSKSFPLGQVVATPGAIAVLEENQESPVTLLRRHSACDWGDVCEEDGELNDEALGAAGRLLSGVIPKRGCWGIGKISRLPSG
jgi:hypothetical protein